MLNDVGFSATCVMSSGQSTCVDNWTILARSAWFLRYIFPYISR